MSRPIIRIEGLGKEYRLGEQEASYSTLGDLVMGSLKNLGKTVRREPFWALKDVTFEVQPGEVMGIIGRNGAGKSTLLKILSRITEPTTGSIDLYGRVASLLEVGTGFHPELSGRENIFLNGAILGMSRREITRRFDEIVAFSEVEKFLDTPVKRYSSGMYTRLAFAVAAHLEPEILIIDEVLAVGDAQFQRKCLGKMGEVASQGRTVLFVSHNLPAIQAFCQSAIVLKQGQLIFEGTPDEAVALHLGSTEVTGDGEVDLREHPNRQTPPAKAAFERLRLLNAEGECTSQFDIGEPIEFEIELNTQDELASPAVVLVVSRQGTEICILSSHFMHNEALSMHGRTTLRCRWEPGWLAPGQYAIDRVVLRRHAGGERIDVVTRPLNFEIAETDLYGNGKHVEGNAILVPNGSWRQMERSLAHERA